MASESYSMKHQGNSWVVINDATKKVVGVFASIPKAKAKIQQLMNMEANDTPQHEATESAAEKKIEGD